MDVHCAGAFGTEHEDDADIFTATVKVVKARHKADESEEDIAPVGPLMPIAGVRTAAKQADRHESEIASGRCCYSLCRLLPVHRFDNTVSKGKCTIMHTRSGEFLGVGGA
jgi:hypothetical protein